MAPTERTRKRQKLSPPTEAQVQPGLSTSQPSTSPTSTSITSPQDDPNNSSSWYNRTWPRKAKAAPITQVARESISSASSSVVETASVIKDKVTPKPGIKQRKSSLALTLGKRTSSKALPASATTTNEYAMPQRRNTQEVAAATPLPEGNDKVSKGTVDAPSRKDKAKNAKSSELASQNTETSKPAEPAQLAEPAQPPAVPQSWIGWLAGADSGQIRAPSASKPDQTACPSPPTGQHKQDQARHVSAEELARNSKIQATPNEPTLRLQEQALRITAAQRRSWLPIWNNAPASQSAPAIASPPEDAQITLNGAPIGGPANTKDIQPQNAPAKPDNLTIEPTNPAVQPQAATKSAAWVFWSRDKPSETQSLKDAPREGEMAVANTESESKPRRASIGLGSDTKRTSITTGSASDADSIKGGKQGKTNSKETRASKLSEAESAQTTKLESKDATATGIAPTDSMSRTVSPAPPKKTYEHQLLPSLHQTLKIPENPTLFQQLTKLFYASKDPDLKHLDLVKEPVRIKNALAIGVHGYFPAPLIQSVLGRPTGTSIKFADMAAKSIRRYTKTKGYECQVKTAALEGEGKIAERIDLLWKLLLNWIDEIRRSDFVMIACHSQGVPVATMLVSKLIHFGCISSTARVGICAMAGVSMGPFPEYKSRWISGSASELFEFSDSASKVSADYLASLDDVLRFGVRVTYVGSIDDQLVSLESSIFAPVSHPHIYRAVSIDSRIHAPSFVSHLVAFALKLRNLGVQDHGLIKELSAPLAGSLYGGDGHSRLYEDDAIYDLAVAFALETTSMPGVPLIRRDIASSGSNPYILPFAMRGILEEDFVKSDLQDEAALLLQQFDDWKPTTKALKDVKFRLEGIRSRL